MQNRVLGSSGIAVSEIGSGCMGLTWAYGSVPVRHRRRGRSRHVIDLYQLHRPDARTRDARASHPATLPRYQQETFEHNRAIVARIEAVADRVGATAGQTAPAWLLAKAPNVVPIPGTTHPEHLRENVDAANVRLTQEDLAELDSLPRPMGDRYPAPKATA